MIKDPINSNYFSSQIKFGTKNFTPKENLIIQTTSANFSNVSKMYNESKKDSQNQFTLP